jgi:predicted nucleic acid-binding protein
MNGTDNRYLLDTNIFIYYFNGELVVQPIVEDILAGNAIGFYCPVTWVELLCYPVLTEGEAAQIRAFLRSLTCVALTEIVLDRTAQIRRDYRIALSDALIAACAMEVASTLVTRNIQDFQQISGLSVINPFNP